MAAREVDGVTDRVIVHDHIPPYSTGAELDDIDLVCRSGREAGSDLVVLRRLVGQSDLVVQARRASRERAEADLNPLIGSVGAGAGSSDPDPAGDVSAE